MVKILTKLRIDEVSSVDRGAGEGCRVVLWKRHDDPPPRPRGLMFNDIVLRKAEDDNEEPRTNAIGNERTLSQRLDEIIAEMIVAAPSLHPQGARRWLLHTPQGQELLAQHSKKEGTTMPEVDIMKLHNIQSVREVAKMISADGNSSGITEHDLTSIVMGHAKLNRRTGESDGAALERILTAPENTELRKAYRVVKGWE
jgi:hypothetical protein